jgi:hypothetical protein
LTKFVPTEGGISKLYLFQPLATEARRLPKQEQDEDGVGDGGHSFSVEVEGGWVLFMFYARLEAWR